VFGIITLQPLTTGKYRDDTQARNSRFGAIVAWQNPYSEGILVAFIENLFSIKKDEILHPNWGAIGMRLVRLYCKNRKLFYNPS
jgi:hypothetical protein